MNNLQGLSIKLTPTMYAHSGKALYNLKQASQAWFEHQSDFLRQCGFINARSKSSLFVLSLARPVIYILIYIDDFIIIEDNPVHFQCFLPKVYAQFRCRDLGHLSYFLGFEMHELSLHQHLHHYSEKVFTRFVTSFWCLGK